MNLLNSYDSSGDEGEEDPKPYKTAVSSAKEVKKDFSTSSRPATTSSSIAKISTEVASNPSKKRRAVIFSTLPIEIQNALARGSTAQDSDSEDDLPAASQSSSKSFRGPGSGLMSLLPAPQNALADPAVTLGATSRQTVKAPLKVAHPREVATVTVKATNIPNNTHVSNDFDSDDDDVGFTPFGAADRGGGGGGGSMFSLNSGKEEVYEEKRKENSIPHSFTKYQENDEDIIDVPSASTSSSHPSHREQSGSSSAAHGVPGVSRHIDTPLNSFPDSYQYGSHSSSSAPLTAFSSSAYSASPSHQQHLSGLSAGIEAEEQDNEQGSADYGSSNSTIGRKRRERDIEQQLINGNMAAAETMGGGMKEMRASNDWNAHAYNIQKQNEAELHKAFFAAKGGEKAIAPVSKLQGRKHQINSLVLAAAKTELSLLNAKGERNKSKAETKGKYGW